METLTKALPGRSKPGSWLRKIAASVLLPGLAIGMALGCGPGTADKTAPTVTSVDPGFGNFQSGTTVHVTGSGFSADLTAVLVGGVTATQTPNTTFDDTQFTFTVPAAAVTGVVTVVTSGGSNHSQTKFMVVPYVPANGVATVPPTGSNPAGPTATPVTITGYGLADITAITINGPSGPVAITPITKTANQITFNIPIGASTGTNTITLANSYVSANAPSILIQFTVTT